MKKILAFCLGIPFLTMMIACNGIQPAANYSDPLLDNATTIQEKIRKFHEKRLEKVSSRIQYFRDRRTGICFAYLGGYYDLEREVQEKESSLASVPCEKVEDLLPDSQRTKNPDR